MTFTREMTAGASLAGTEGGVGHHAVDAQAHVQPDVRGSKWMSEAPSSTAWAMIEFTA